MAKELIAARRQRRSAKGAITGIEENVVKLEATEKLDHKDHSAIQRHLQKLDYWDVQFRREHEKVGALIEEVGKELDEMYDHEERLLDFIGCLEVLILAEEAKPPVHKPGPDKFYKRLND